MIAPGRVPGNPPHDYGNNPFSAGIFDIHAPNELTLFHTRVARSAGGQVPDGTPIVDTEFTNSRKYTDEKIAKKGEEDQEEGEEGFRLQGKKLKKKAKKLKEKSKKSWTQARVHRRRGGDRVHGRLDAERLGRPNPELT